MLRALGGDMADPVARQRARDGGVAARLAEALVPAGGASASSSAAQPPRDAGGPERSALMEFGFLNVNRLSHLRSGQVAYTKVGEVMEAAAQLNLDGLLVAETALPRGARPPRNGPYIFDGEKAARAVPRQGVGCPWTQNERIGNVTMGAPSSAARSIT